VAARGGLAAVFYLTAVLAVAGIVLVIWRVPTPPRMAGGHDDTGAVPGLLVQSIKDVRLMRLNFGVFVLHFVLMACFLVVPQLLESVADIAKEQHWQVYLVALVLSVIAMAPLMRNAEKGGRPQSTFALAIALLLVSLALLGFVPRTGFVYLGLWLFFTGFNYLEATLPSLVSKTVFAGGKGTALGVYSTCQFLGAFTGGAIGGWVLQQGSVTALFYVCIVLVGIWLWVALPSNQVIRDEANPAPN
jgi:predicted MFS family arabinose efflux permease